jgi:peptide/nickel transport system substrate-binding protein
MMNVKCTPVSQQGGTSNDCAKIAAETFSIHSSAFNKMLGLIDNCMAYLRNIFSGIRYLPHFRLSYIRKVFSLMGNKERITALALLGIAIISLLFSLRNFYYDHTVTAPSFGGVYVEGVVGQPAYINPLLASGETDLSLEKLVYSGLYKFDGTGNFIPDLADGHPLISQDQKQYTINLKKNVRWHNDRSFTADDVVFTIQKLQDPAYKSPLRSLWMSTTVEKLGDYQVRFTTKDISGPFLYNLTLPILPKNVWENVSPQVFLTSINNLQAVGTGPFSIKEIKKEASGRVDQISLDSFSNYYSGKPKIDSVIVKFYDTNDDLLNALNSKEIQGLGFTAADSNLHIDATNETQQLTVPLPQYQVLFYNLNNKILNDIAIRKALSSAVDRQGIIDSIFKGFAKLPPAPFTFEQDNVPEPKITYSIEQAKQALDAAGWKVDPITNLRTKKGVVLQLNIATNNSLSNSKTAEAIANSWRSIQVQVALTVLSTQDLNDTLIRPRKFDVLIFPLRLGADPDPFAFWQSSQVKDPGLNLTGFSSQAVDKLINQARNTTDFQARQALYGQFSALISEQVPALFLNQAEYAYVLDKTVKNTGIHLLLDPSDRFYDVQNWYIQEKRVWK